MIETCYFSSQEKKDRDKSRDKDKDRDRERERDRDREKDRRRDKGDRKESTAEEPNDVKMEEPSVDKGELSSQFQPKVQQKFFNWQLKKLLKNC